MSSEFRLIVGLGNFGKEYDGTYHNVGFETVDRMLARIGGECRKRECKSLTCHAIVDGRKAIVAKPQTYMNLSGEAVAELMRRYKIPPKDVLVVCDDIDLSPGSIRLRTKGSGGTHNGLRNIVQNVGEDFNRLRMGIGKPPERFALVDYVLARISGENAELLRRAEETAAQALIDFAAGDEPERIGSNVNVKR